MHTQPILAFDTACHGASVALVARGTTATLRLEQSAQAAQLLPAIDGLMREAGVAYRDLGCIVTTLGPGSFTGVRIGLATLHGLVLVTGTPVRTLSTLAAMAWRVALSTEAPARFHIALRAGKGELYTQPFVTQTGKVEAQGEITLVAEDFTAWDTPCFGNHLPDTDPHHLPGPDAATLCTIATQLDITPLAAALPLYIRPPDAVAGARPAWLGAN
ncbi:MAG: tRNA (adenosine(37)-N6)-threonylcarbamoyltransferase complex dimerization subunit type 1 TsaB [Alphaproteobacteria bacterium]|nr:tRNA (adenosine(37)-N6)-threonylcarbamoyltransferase complex dimerization subunit type 1 TsaB [Alphaproteobacteria bacterium]